jgi:hypothetical protein
MLDYQKMATIQGNNNSKPMIKVFRVILILSAKVKIKIAKNLSFDLTVNEISNLDNFNPRW